MVAHSEGTAGKGDDGYNVLVDGGLFHSYRDHPRVLVDLPHLGIKSTAAGRYQLLARFYDVYKKQLRLSDFGYDAQDAIALQQVRECAALDDVDAGRVEAAIKKCCHIWASLPGAGYGQHENKMAVLVAAFREAGGVAV